MGINETYKQKREAVEEIDNLNTKQFQGRKNQNLAKLALFGIFNRIIENSRFLIKIEIFVKKL